MKLVNLTPHAVNLWENGSVETLLVPPENVPARCEETSDVVATVHLRRPGTPYDVEFPIKVMHFGNVTGLPDPEPDTWYIVSRMVAEALPDRDDLVYPTDLLRDPMGVIIGCGAFGVVEE